MATQPVTPNAAPPQQKPDALIGQIQEARKHGYKDDEIMSYLGKSNPDLAPKIQQAIGAGYKPEEILNHLAPPPPERTGLQTAVEVGKGAVKQLLTTGRGFANVASLGLGEKALGDKGRAALDSKLKLRNTPQEVGGVAEQVGEALVPIPGMSAIKAAQGAKLVTKMLVGAVREGLDVGTRAAVQSGGDVSKTAEGAGFGGALGAAVPLLGSVLKAGARAQYGRLLHPSGKNAQQVVEAKLLPKDGQGIKGVGSILDQGLKAVGTSRDAIAKKFSEQVKAATKEMNDVYTSLGPQAQVNLHPVLNDLAKFIKDNAVLPNGETVDKLLYARGIQLGRKLVNKTMATLLGDAPVQDVRRFRQIIDRQLFRKKLKVNAASAADDVKMQLRDSIADVIHSQHPTTAAVDAKFHFWKTAHNLMKDASTAEIGKGEEASARSNVPVRIGKDLIMAAAGEEAGRREGGTPGAIAGFAAGATLGEAFNSPAWRSVSAVSKNKVANLLSTGKGQAAADAATRALGWGLIRTTQPPTNPKDRKAEEPPTPKAAAPASSEPPQARPNPYLINKPGPPVPQASNKVINPPGVFVNQGAVSELPREDIHVDGDRFQFREGAKGKHAVTKKAGKDEDFDRERAGPLAVWKDPEDGKTYVVDGHHRLQRANASKYGKPLYVQYIDAKTADEARVKGELLNVHKDTHKPPDEDEADEN